jgi:type I restriction enzyme, S subunit
MSEWREASLESVCSRLRSGNGITAKDIHESGDFPVFGGNGIRGYTSDSNFCGECAIIGRQGAYCGNVRYFRGTARMSEHAVVACADSDNDTRFLAYLLSTMNLGRLSGQAAQPGLSVKVLAQQSVRVPPLDVQRRIASVLGSMDDLIENNRRRVEALENMARTIYREWFVKFRYPGHEDVPLVDSALGPIPEGWEQRNLFNAAEVGFGYSFKSPRFAPTGPNQVIRIRDIPVGISATFTDEDADPRYAVFDDDVLIGMDGDFHMTVWTGGDAWLNQRVTRLRPKVEMSPLHLLLAIEGQIIEWNRAIVGTTVAHLGKKHLELVNVMLPDHKTLADATGLFDALMGQRRSLEQSSRRMSALRDLLLPKLVTGQIDVSVLDLGAVIEKSVA